RAATGVALDPNGKQIALTPDSTAVFDPSVGLRQLPAPPIAAVVSGNQNQVVLADGRVVAIGLTGSAREAAVVALIGTSSLGPPNDAVEAVDSNSAKHLIVSSGNQVF